MSLFLSLFMYALWSTIFPLTKLSLAHASPLFLVGIRMTIAGMILLGFLMCTQRACLKISFKQWISLTLLAFLSVYVSNVLECTSLQHLSASKTCFIFSLGPFFSAFFSYLHFGEKMNGRKWLGMFIGFAGIFPVLYVQKGSEELLTSIPFLSWPELAAMGAAVCSVYGWVLLRKLVQNISPTAANGISMLIGGALALSHSLFADVWNPIPVPRAEWGSFVQILGIMIVISNLVCYSLYGALLKRFTATILSFMGLFSPVFASLSSWMILNETPSTAIFLSTGILLFGLWMVYSAELKQGYLKARVAA